MKKIYFLIGGICGLLMIILVTLYNNFAGDKHLKPSGVFLNSGMIQTNISENLDYDEKCREPTINSFENGMIVNSEKDTLNEENKTEYDDLVYREYSHGYKIEKGCFLRVDKDTLTKVCEYPQYVVIYVNGDEFDRIAIDEENKEYQTVKAGNYEIYLVDKEGHYYDILTKVKVFEPAGSLMMVD